MCLRHSSTLVSWVWISTTRSCEELLTIFWALFANTWNMTRVQLSLPKVRGLFLTHRFLLIPICSWIYFRISDRVCVEFERKACWIRTSVNFGFHPWSLGRDDEHGQGFRLPSHQLLAVHEPLDQKPFSFRKCNTSFIRAVRCTSSGLHQDIVRSLYFVSGGSFYSNAYVLVAMKESLYGAFRLLPRSRSTFGVKWPNLIPTSSILFLTSWWGRLQMVELVRGDAKRYRIL